MCAAAKNYYKDMEKVKNFSLYNTPVLDFIQKKQGTRTNPLIAVLCKESGYGRGLQMALKEISEQVMLFSSWEKGKKELGKKRLYGLLQKIYCQNRKILSRRTETDR